LELLWQLVGDQKVNDPMIANSLATYIKTLTYGKTYYYRSDPPASLRRQALADFEQHSRTGTTWERLVALSLLLALDKTAAHKIAVAIVEDEELSDEFRSSAFRIALLSQSGDEADATAIGGVASKVESIQRISLEFLTMGAASIASLGDGEFDLESGSYGGSNRYSQGGKPILPEAPEGITVAMLSKWFESGDARTQALAGYLLVLMNEEQGLEPLMRFWANEMPDDRGWTRLTYRAIAYWDDDQHVTVLRSIYQKNPPEKFAGDIRDFYWTIRIMTGDEALKLRKQIRDDVGMDSLR
jgi:hypothetical protein